MLFGDARERVEDILVALPKPDRKTDARALQH
jgi:NAD(P) transhydrogenase subunit beta